MAKSYFYSLLLTQLFIGQTAGASKTELEDKTLKLAWESMPTSLDSRYASDANSQYLEDLIHCSIIRFSEDGSTEPYLASKWNWKSSNQLAIKLHQNFRFSSGAAVTGADVVATYDFFGNGRPEKPSSRAAAFKNLNKVELDKKSGEVVFFLERPDPTFLTNLVVGILPASTPKDRVLRKPSEITGCGPFVLDEVTQKRLSLKRNPYFPEAVDGKIEQVTVKIVKDETTRFSKLRVGEIHLVQNALNRETASKIKRKFPNLQLARRPGLKTTYLGFNMQDSVLKHRAVRKAIGMAIDRDTIIRYALSGFATPAESLLTPADAYFKSPENPLQFNPKLAESTLDSAGFKVGKDGKRFTLTYKTTQNATRIEVAKAIAGMLKKIKVDIKIQSLEWGRFQADINAGNFQMWSLAWIGFKDPDILHHAFSSESIPPNGGNRGRFSNVRIDKILKEARQTLEPAKRKDLYDTAQDLLYQEMPYFFLWHEDQFAVFRENVKNFKIYADGRYSSLKDVLIQ